MKFQRDMIKKNPAISTKGVMPADIDLERALICSELSVVSYRHFSRGKTVTNKTLDVERQHIEKYGRVFGYQSVVLSTSNQQCVIFYNDREVLVAFEGSSLAQLKHYDRNLTSYFMSWFEPAPEIIKQTARRVMGIPDVVPKVHWGFDNALNQPLVDDNSKTLWEGVKDELATLCQQKPERSLFFCGHSAGGALATIATARTFNDLPQLKIDGLYTFGQPRVGGKYFRAGLESLLGRKYFRFEQFGDPMPALPPYSEEEYVHAGQWVPMDMDGHVLKMEDKIDIKDTLSRSDKRWSARIGRAYETLMSPLRGLASNSQILSELINSFDPVARSTHSSLHNLFSTQNYEVHRAVSYSRALHEHIKERWNSPRRHKMLAESDGQSLLYSLLSFDDFLKDSAGVQVDGAVRDAIVKMEATLNTCLNEWQGLCEHPPQIWLSRSRSLQEKADVPSLPSFSPFQWFFGSEPEKLPSPHEVAEDVGEQAGRKFSAARMVRGIQRASRIEQVYEAVNQFRHDIAHATADPNANWYLRELSDMADQLHHDTESYRSQLSPGLSNSRA